MDKYFELQYWLNITALIVLGIFILVGVLWFLISIIIDAYRSKSKKWQYDCVKGRWEKVNKNV